MPQSEGITPPSMDLICWYVRVQVLALQLEGLSLISHNVSVMQYKYCILTFAPNERLLFYGAVRSLAIVLC